MERSSSVRCPYPKHPVWCGGEWCYPNRKYCKGRWSAADIEASTGVFPARKRALLNELLLQTERLSPDDVPPQRLLEAKTRKFPSPLSSSPLTSSSPSTDWREARRSFRGDHPIFLNYETGEQVVIQPFTETDFQLIERYAELLMKHSVDRHDHLYATPWLKAESLTGRSGLIYAPNFFIETRQAVWDYEADSDAEVSFRESDTITVLDKPYAEWWVVQTPDGSVGYAPANYLAICRVATTDSKKREKLRYSKDDQVYLLEEDDGFQGWTDADPAQVVRELPPELKDIGLACDDDEDDDTESEDGLTEAEQARIEKQIRREELQKEQARMKQIEAAATAPKKGMSHAAPAAGLSDLVDDLLTQRGLLKMRGGGRAERWQRYMLQLH